MSDIPPSTSPLQMCVYAGWFISGMAPFMFVPFILDDDADSVYRKLKLRTKIMLWTVVLTGALWMPWVIFGGYSLVKLSSNTLSYFEQPSTVIPEDPKTIDLRQK